MLFYEAKDSLNSKTEDSIKITSEEGWKKKDELEFEKKVKIFKTTFKEKNFPEEKILEYVRQHKDFMVGEYPNYLIENREYFNH